MPEPDLNTRVLDKLFHITQLTAEIRQLVAEEKPEELPPIDAAITPSKTAIHRLAKQLEQAPLGTVRH